MVPTNFVVDKSLKNYGLSALRTCHECAAYRILSAESLLIPSMVPLIRLLFSFLHADRRTTSSFPVNSAYNAIQN